jgi:GNAT superfamily N-acetyltransferase
MMRFVTYREAPDLLRRYDDEAEPLWPAHMEFMYHDEVCEAYWPRLETEFAPHQFLVYDDADDRLLGQGNTIPLRWSGRDEDLPDGVPAVLHQAFRERAEDVEATALCALLAVLRPSARSRGLSSEALRFMRELARRDGLRWLIAPVRPTLKERYPLTPMERYVRWRDAEGRAFDPWLRTHERLGARFAGIGPRGNVFRGTPSEWETWTGLAMPESGEYVVRGAQNPVVIDREGDDGVLVEPNVWMVHSVAGA